MNCLSLGWGVQSFTLAAMAALGEIHVPDCAIHADTTHEMSATYEFAETWTPWLTERGLNVVVVKPDPKYLDNTGWIRIPAYSVTGGPLRRQCTLHWKLDPIHKWLREHRNGQPVTMLIGISWDEAIRMKDSRIPWITNTWPLVERRMTRNACRKWLLDHDLPEPAKSSCVFCPYHGGAEWRAVRDRPEDMAKAIAYDEQIRHMRGPECYVHRSCKPLSDVDLRSEEEMGQLAMFDEECEGICGI